MTFRSRRLTGVALLGAAALTLTACGGDDEPSAAPSASETSEAPAATGACDSFEAPEDSAGPATPLADPAPGDGVLTIGSVLPQTGNLAFLGPPEFAGVDLAIAEINEAGGVLGAPVAYLEGDSGDAQQDVANPTVDRLLAANVDAIVGAASSGVSFSFIDKVTSAGVVHYSPANTSPDFTSYDDKGLYFRTAPSDVLQGRVLGETVVADGGTNVGIISLQDPYGEGLALNVGLAVCNSGASVATETIFYDPGSDNFSAPVGELAAAQPDAIVLIGFEESAEVIQAMVAQQIGPQDVPLYLVDGNLGNALGEGLPAGLLEGVRGSLPGAEATEEFRARLLEIDPALQDYSYSAESYDAVITTAIAAVVAGNDSGTAIAAELPDVTRGGEKCETFADCLALAEAGTDLDYDGVSGPIEFSDVGDPTEATIGIYTFGADNTLSDEVEFQAGSLN